MLKLREAIAASVAKHFHAGYDPKNEILIAVGVSEAMDIAFRAHHQSGDEVIYHEPCYVSYDPGIAWPTARRRRFRAGRRMVSR